MGGVLAWLSAFAANLFGSSVVSFLAFKVVLYALFVTILPIVLNNVFKKIIDGVISVANTYAGSGAPSMVVTFTGAAASLVNIVGLPFAFSIIIAACAFKLTLRMIPFVRL